MTNSSKKQENLPKVYTEAEFDLKLNEALENSGISVKVKERPSSATSKPRTYEVKMIPQDKDKK